MSPLLAQSGHPLVKCTCPLLGVKRTWPFALHMSANDPKRTFQIYDQRRIADQDKHVPSVRAGL